MTDPRIPFTCSGCLISVLVSAALWGVVILIAAVIF